MVSSSRRIGEEIGEKSHGRGERDIRLMSESRGKEVCKFGWRSLVAGESNRGKRVGGEGGRKREGEVS